MLDRVAACWHHQTSKGGVSMTTPKYSAKWLLRLILWKTGEGENYFLNVKQDNRYSYEDSSSGDESDDKTELKIIYMTYYII